MYGRLLIRGLGISPTSQYSFPVYSLLLLSGQTNIFNEYNRQRWWDNTSTSRWQKTVTSFLLASSLSLSLAPLSCGVGNRARNRGQALDSGWWGTETLVQQCWKNSRLPCELGSGSFPFQDFEKTVALAKTFIVSWWDTILSQVGHPETEKLGKLLKDSQGTENTR